MAWCPKCRNEYVEGVTTCAECGIELVEELPEEIDSETPVVLMEVESEPFAEKIFEYLQYCDIGTAAIFPPSDETDKYQLVVAEFEKEEAENMLLSKNPDELSAWIDDKLSEIENEQAQEMFSDLRTEASSVYVKKKDKYADLKFSGVSFLIFGVVGLAMVILNFMDVIQWMNEFSMVIMGVVFVLFLIVGVVSLVRARTLRDIVSEEEKITDEVMSWIDENITDEVIENLMDPNLSQEDNYFSVHGQLCRMVTEKFPFFSANYADELMDERYSDYCDKEDKE